MITLEMILKYIEHLREFYSMPKKSNIRFILFEDGSCSIRADDNYATLASFDSIGDLHSTVERLSLFNEKKR